MAKVKVYVRHTQGFECSIDDNLIKLDTNQPLSAKNNDTIYSADFINEKVRQYEVAELQTIFEQLVDEPEVVGIEHIKTGDMLYENKLTIQKEEPKKTIYCLVSDLSNCLLDVAEGYNVDSVEKLEKYVEGVQIRILNLLKEV